MEAYETVKNNQLYQAFRIEGFPTQYNDNKTGVTIDLHVVIVVAIFATVAIAFLFVLPGFRGKERVFVFTRSFTSLLIGFLIFFCNIESDWESAEIDARVQYKANEVKHINATIGLHIGLRGINITLRGNPNKQLNEIIDYNEHFSWEWDQGRFGFGPQAGRFQQQYRTDQYKGLPYPILWVAEYFTLDGEGLRFGRHYRLAGWYTHILLWLAFPLWLLANLLFFMVIQYGALFLLFTGLTLICGNVLYVAIRNPIPLKIPFQLGAQTGFLFPRYASCFYLNLINGIFCIVIGILAFLADLRYPDETAEFFGIRVLQSYEEYYADDAQEIKANIEAIENGLQAEIEPISNQIYAGLKKRVLSDRLSRLQRSTTRKKPAAKPRQKLSAGTNSGGAANSSENSGKAIELPLYENFRQFEPIGEEAEENQF